MIKVQKLTPSNLLPPMQQKEGDAGYDLRSDIVAIIKPGEQRVIPTGYAFQIPHGFVGFVKSRSGLAVKHRIHVHEDAPWDDETRAGVIDSSFRGELKVVLVNEGDKRFIIEHGDRIAQMVVVPCMMGPVDIVSQLEDSERGSDGFNSTGVK